MLPIDVSGETVAAGDVWSLTADDEKNWRPGGIRPSVADAQGAGYFLMHAHGAEGTHKDPGTQVWVYDLDAGKRIKRLELKNMGLSVGVAGSGDTRLMFVTNVDMGVDVYRLPGGEFVQTLSAGMTPFLVHGAD